MTGQSPSKKVSGCCMMIRMDFLRSTGYLDENVFLYCEEPILSVRVHAAGGKILYLPWVSATHAHVPGEKEDSAKRMLLFIKNRKYYLRQYSGYNRQQQVVFSCHMMFWLFIIGEKASAKTCGSAGGEAMREIVAPAVTIIPLPFMPSGASCSLLSVLYLYIGARNESLPPFLRAVSS